ncbi:hypothetical protein [Legionella sp. CNM-4043-24]|uniref:hypothetical protein n=1 Tax=Legionella sp. CNM-4043-24 TaxID=3421646 RepID=UPI00403AD182
MPGQISQLISRAVTGTIDGTYDFYRKFIFTGETDGKIGRKAIESLFSPVNQEREYLENLASITVAKDARASNPFETWSKERLSSLEDFCRLKSDDGKPLPFASSLAEKLKTPSDELTAIRTAFDTALAEDAGTQAAKAEFAKNIAAINAVLNDDSSVHLAAMATYLQELKAKAKADISTQHQAETTRVTELFSRPDFSKAMGLAAGEVEKFKQDTLDALKKSQEKELQKLDSTVSEEANKLLRNNADEAQRIAYLATMWKESTLMRRKMRELAEANENNGPLEIDYDSDTGTARFKNISVRDMGIIETITGTKINITPGATPAEDSFEMKMPKYGFLYYRSNKMEMDLLSLAMATRACGHKGIVMSVTDNNDPERAMMIARKQFEACVAAGFNPESKPDPKDPKKTRCAIAIVVNGKKIENPQQELFAKHSEMYKKIMQKYHDGKEMEKRLTGAATPQSIQAMKGIIQAKRQEMEATPPAPEPGSSPAP